ncbi:orc1/cdc6 family replication initiation protein [Natrinema pellirubrum DSM 15624]|uniref:ORC1-type DNA replication protein n=2 Tax=Natrinema pellirubrum (strain DSM 15624 / CIP 106293 / JCM 10476 / NCIMB 786 / 157) TaxID=797303 RepID=L0JMM0_NATP1|nr:AAA family ATPase [Natrinema pellirubrum]AGB31802.1 orc1/cdc6 family replication initiation protein [Natrinema pellirubrum DSM 15624]
MGNDPIPTPSVEDLQDDPMADEATSIFRRRELLRPQHVPQKDRIVGRDREIETVEALLKPAAFGDPPESGFLFGKTGTGKSLVAKHVTGRARGIAQMQGTDLTAAYVDCDQYNTETRAARTMAFEVRDAIDPDRYIPKEGIGASRYYDALWDSDGLLHESDSLIVILDEIDKLGDDTAEILSKLSRSEEAGKTGCYISVVAISNKTDYSDAPDERVASSFQDDPIIFPPYDANQLQAILERRSDAFKDGVLEEGAIQLASALAARDHGDARRALDILRSAGKLAEKDDSDRVTEEYVRQADEYSDLNRSIQVIKNGTPHSRYALYALAYLTKSKLKDSFSTGELYDAYCIVAEVAAGESLTHQRVLDLMKKWTLPEITESKHTGGGKGEGSYRTHRLLHDPDVVMSACLESSETQRDVLDALSESSV